MTKPKTWMQFINFDFSLCWDKKDFNIRTRLLHNCSIYTERYSRSKHLFRIQNKLSWI